MEKQTLFRFYYADLSTSLLLPYFEFGLVAGFPSPASQYKAQPIDLNMALLIDKINTRFKRIEDDNLEGKNIFCGDLAVIDAGLQPLDGDALFCIVHGEPLARIFRIKKKEGKKYLVTTNPDISPVEINPDIPMQTGGVITYTITPHIPVTFHANGGQDSSIDINKLLIKNPVSTFLGLIKGDSMKDALILNGDLAIIDRSVPYIDGYKALCRIGEKFTVKFLEWDKENNLYLTPANNGFKPIKVTGNKHVEVFGVIIYTITPHLREFRRTL